jgi:mannose-6-phosphate isomerase-like protein (cupin superfamily)
VQRVQVPSRAIEHFGSQGFTHHRLARGSSFQVSLAEIDGMIGGHEAVSRQLLVVVHGRVRCATRTDAVDLGVGDAVEWQEGEWHETRSLEPSRVVIVEGDWE